MLSNTPHTTGTVTTGQGGRDDMEKGRGTGMSEARGSSAMQHRRRLDFSDCCFICLPLIMHMSTLLFFSLCITRLSLPLHLYLSLQQLSSTSHDEWQRSSPSAARARSQISDRYDTHRHTHAVESSEDKRRRCTKKREDGNK